MRGRGSDRRRADEEASIRGRANEGIGDKGTRADEEARNEEMRRRWEEGKRDDRTRKRGMRRRGNGDEQTMDKEMKGRADERPSGQEKRGV